jgi:hypothetical protein
VEVAADGSTITALLPPNASPLTITNVSSDGAPTLLFNPQTSVPVTTPVVDSVPATVSSATPAAGAPIILTSTDPNFTFDANTTVNIGGTTAITTGVAGDGSSVTVVAAPGAAGTLTVNGAIVGGFPLILPATAGTVTVGAIGAAILGTDDPATAPAIEAPAGAQVRGVVDNGANPGYAACGDVGLPCQVYQFVVPADGSYDFQATWEGTSDVGIYFLGSDGATLTGNFDCDGHANGATAQPEECTQEFVAGTYYVAYVPFGPFYTVPEPNPQWFQITVTPHAE